MDKDDINEWLLETSKCTKINNNRHIDRSFKPLKVENKNNFSKDIEINYNLKSTTNINKNNIILKKNQSLGIDNNTDRKLRLGHYPIDLRVDFHGLTIDEAFDSLIYYVNFAYNQGMKCLLVITGKGKNTKDGRETIKSSIEKWLTIDCVSNKIIKYVDAQPKDGGKGALYILLKKSI